MAPEVEVQVSPHPSPPRPPAATGGGGGVAPPSPPPQQPENDAPEKLTPHSSPPHNSTAIVVAADSYAAQYNAQRGNVRYVPPRAAEGTAYRAAVREGGRGDGRAWYPWSGRNSDPRPPPPPPPPPPPQVRAVEADRENRVVSDIVWRDRRAAAMQRAELAARGAGAALCLAALAVLAADHRKGWALDSYSNYSQFRYSEAVNVIGFLYSVFQVYALAELLRKKKRVIPKPKGNYFDFAMDQVLAYLLISSSSSATARVGDWIDNWGSDPFPNMANSSIALSFLAFLVFAVSSLISAYNLFRQDL